MLTTGIAESAYNWDSKECLQLGRQRVLTTGMTESAYNWDDREALAVRLESFAGVFQR